ncbi:MAG: DUF1592 domain-containing protein [Acidobacteria bacterium]|nr:DUF1592 domain-containing protein [Acidobacteriota bacterium]
MSSIVLALALAATSPVTATARAPSLTAKYCVGCHNTRSTPGGVNLTGWSVSTASRHAELAEKVVKQVRTGLMPPAGLPIPPVAVRKQFVETLQTRLDQAAALRPNPGAPALHRLNRVEYANSVRDLLGLNVDVSSLLPTDDLTRGFDNMADGLTISPTLVEAYVRAAGKVSREAVGDPQTARTRATYTLPRVISQTRHIEGTPFGTRGGIAVQHNFPVDGEYVFRLSFYFHQMGTTLFGRTLGKGQQIEVSIDGERKAIFDIDPAMKQFEELKTPPIKVPAGPHRLAAAFPRKFDGPVEDLISPVEHSLVDVNVANIPGLTSLPHLHDLIVDGPLAPGPVSETPSRRRIFSCMPEPGIAETACAKEILGRLARQAYRRPLNGGDVDRLLTTFQRARNQGDFESGIQAGLQSILSNPEFVFRFEKQPASIPPGTNYRVSNLELASRLSYFLWSSAPDEVLLTAANNGTLRQPAVLEVQVRRMLADPKAEALATNFAGQWLNLQNLKEASPDPLLFPNFDRNLARSMRRETELLVLSLIRENRSVLDLLTADYTHVDERLAKHYGIPNILGNRFRRVTVPDERRRGLLGHGSILTLTSVANRTAPVIRGKWVLEVLLGTPPPPPPPNVPALKENGDNTKPTSVRDRLQEHRANPACSSCHKLMDPIGFALENYDAVGIWRTSDNGFPVDAAAELFDGTRLNGPASLRQAILNHSDAYLETFAERLLSYGVGRVLNAPDMPAVRAVARAAAKDQHRFSAFVLAVVNSLAFQQRRAERPKTPAVQESGE